MKELFLLVLENGNSACAKTAFLCLGDLLLVFSKTYTVKCLDRRNSDSQGHSKYISIERMS